MAVKKDLVPRQEFGLCLRRWWLVYECDQFSLNPERKHGLGYRSLSDLAPLDHVEVDVL